MPEVQGISSFLSMFRFVKRRALDVIFLSKAKIDKNTDFAICVVSNAAALYPLGYTNEVPTSSCVSSSIYIYMYIRSSEWGVAINLPWSWSSSRCLL